uniref:HMG box domain-containing protein n=1 Tax=Timema monikensis TaxID=170555 RepID=A0A7R9HUA0_9NEOP|nr:unnamed protein product [Timema monikensis]
MSRQHESRRNTRKSWQQDTNKLISVRLGECWKSMPNYSKAFYFEAAEDVKREHKKYYPSYYYNPMEARCKKIEKKNKKKSKHNFV